MIMRMLMIMLMESAITKAGHAPTRVSSHAGPLCACQVFKNASGSFLRIVRRRPWAAVCIPSAERHGSGAHHLLCNWGLPEAAARRLRVPCVPARVPLQKMGVPCGLALLKERIIFFLKTTEHTEH